MAGWASSLHTAIPYNGQDRKRVRRIIPRQSRALPSAAKVEVGSCDDLGARLPDAACQLM
jgi:hypothetical protein